MGSVDGGLAQQLVFRRSPSVPLRAWLIDRRESFHGCFSLCRAEHSRLAAGVDGTYGDVRLYAVLATVADKATGDGDGDRTTSQEKRFLSAIISLMEARGCALSGDDRAKLAEIRANVRASVCSECLCVFCSGVGVWRGRWQHLNQTDHFAARVRDRCARRRLATWTT